MIKHIIEKEIRDNLTSTKFIITFSVCSLLILLSFYTGANNYKVARMQYEAAKQENFRQLEGLTDWRMVKNYRIFLPPQPLAALVTGISNDIGRTVEIRGRGELSAEDSRFGDDPIFAIFRFLDLEFIFQVVLSLFAILFAYDAINGEKERGTLPLTFSYSVSRRDYILGKTAGSFLSLNIPLLIPLLIGAGLLPVFGVSLTGDELIRFILIFLTGILYISVFLFLSVFISTVTYKSSSSFLVLLVIWIFCVIIIPRLSVITAGSLINVPGIDEINSKKVKLSTQLWNEDRNKINKFQPPQSSDMQMMMNEFNKFMQDIADKRDKKIQELSSRLNEERQNKQIQMENLAFGIARISPAASLSFAISNLSGTSIKLEDLFKQSASSYQNDYAKFMVQKTGMNMGFLFVQRIEPGGEKPKAINPREIPEFIFRKESLGETLNAAIPDIGILFLFSLVFFTAAFFSFRKYDLR
jgi:ABC-type transport system involved in multi-copper enzyme maturation permease subunit